MGAIYQIRNRVTGKVYIGSAVDALKRFRNHRTNLRRGVHHCGHLQMAWNKYGESAFRFQFLEACEPDQLAIREQAHLDAHAPEELYNILPVAYSPLGKRHSEETKAKIGAALRGRKASEEARAKMSAAQKNNEALRGHKHSEETRAKMSATQKGRKFSEETRARMSEAQKRRRRREAQL